MVLFRSDHRHGFKRQLLVLLLVLLALGTLMSSSHARPVKEVGATEKGFGVEGESNSLSLKKEILDSVPKASDQVQTSARNGGRKGGNGRRKRSRRSEENHSKKLQVSMAKGVGDENWKDNYMAFSADYRSPKPHPPRNN